MRQVGLPELLVFLVAAVLLAGGKKVGDIAQGFADAINTIKGGGPGSPSHPIPADDSRLLTRKRTKKDQG